MSATERLAGTPDQVGKARRIVATALGDDHPCRDEAMLLTSETTTNAVRHTRSDQGQFTLTIEHTAHWARVTVGDEGSARIPCSCRAAVTATGGRGVTLLDHLASSWGFRRKSTGSTELWFEVSADQIRT
jgi:anti-sigma regulatory factor (Ser/Thr protein kinase)